MSIDRAAIEELLAKPLDDLFEGIAKDIEREAITILNEALTNHGASGPMVEDGTSHPMSEYVAESEIPAVLAEARQIVVERGLSGGDAGNPLLVKTDDDALAYILGFSDDDALVYILGGSDTDPAV